MRFEEAVAELDARQPEHMPKPDLDRMRALAALLDDPQLTYPTIHVTGTNGKTTTARLTAAIACAHGLTSGLFTSPHLLSVTERFEICGEPIADQAFGDEFEHLRPFLRTVDEQVGPVTYFEALAALGFLVFADAPVQLGVFEVGMGGTWDATNLIASDVAVICPIGLDHPELGSTIAEVAGEKAGIIKEGKVAVVRDQPPEALEVLERRCEEQIATMLLERLFDLTADDTRRGYTLEVRVSNEKAIALYERLGFRSRGLRRGYYTDNREDAIIMWTDRLKDRSVRDRLAKLRAALETTE